MIRALTGLLAAGMVSVCSAGPLPPASGAIDTSRLVVLGGAVGETVYALGAEDRLVGADQSCTWPRAITEVTSVGYHRQLSAEGVLSLKPTAVIGTTAAGPATAIEQLRAAGVPVVLLPATPDVATVRDNILRMGGLLGRPEEAAELAERVVEETAAVGALAAAQPRRPKVLFLMSSPSSDRFNAAGAGTAVEAVVRLAGGEPVFQDFGGYKPVSAESIAAAAPDIILYPGGTQHGAGFAKDWTKNPALAATPAVRGGRVHAVDLGLVAGFGPRVGEAVDALYELFYSQPAGGMAAAHHHDADDS